MKRIGFLSVALAAMLTVACGGNGRDNEANIPDDKAAVGTGGAERDANRDRGVDAGTRRWVEDRLRGGMAEVKLGELASERARNADVKAFGRMMVQDHTKAGEELKQIAAQQNIQPPTELDDEHRDLMDRLSKAQGAEFDREYMNAMVDSHEKTINALEDRVDRKGDENNPQFSAKEAQEPFESSVNQWAAKTAPTVHKHLERARQLNEKVGRRLTDDNR